LDYRLLCAEREAEPALREVAQRCETAYQATTALVSAIAADERHQSGEPWPALRREMSEPGHPVATSFAAYRKAYEAASLAPTDSNLGARVFWSWCLTGVSTGRFWAGWSGRIRETGSPVETGPLPAPFVVVWSPGWPVTAGELAAAVAGAYFDQFTEHTAALHPESVSIRALQRQARWLRDVEAAARSILEAGVTGAIHELSESRHDGVGILRAWLVEEGARLDPALSTGDLARALRSLGLEKDAHGKIEDRLRLAASYWSKQQKKAPDLRRIPREKSPASQA
jgi:hypothetical protein